MDVGVTQDFWEKIYHKDRWIVKDTYSTCTFDIITAAFIGNHTSDNGESKREKSKAANGRNKMQSTIVSIDDPDNICDLH